MTGSAAQTWIPYCGSAPVPAEWLSRWNFDLVLLAALLLALLSIQLVPSHRTGPRARLVGAVALAAFLFVSPFCALGSALFTVRTLHHVLLLTAFAALIAELPALTRAAGRLPLSSWTGIQLAIFWGWHAPPLYSAALSSDLVFWAMQISMGLSAAIWWAAVIKAVRQSEAGAAVIALLATMVLTGLLGALLTFAASAFYAPHWLTTQAWGLSPLEDQQLAGIIMWAPASAIYLLAACTILYRSLGFRPMRETAH